jgi:hypothetical protein
MKFFNVDCHISVISDVKNIFEKFGHTVDNWSLSNHRFIFGWPPCPSPILTQQNWQFINQELCDKFYDHHKNELDQYDGFIVTYPVPFFKLFERFNKPVITIAPIRYDFPVLNDPERMHWVNDSINNNKNLILITNNQFDKKYCETFTTNKWRWIPSLCDYTNEKYNPIHKEAVCFSRSVIEDTGIIHQSKLGNYSWKDLYAYKAIVHFPYHNSTMSLFEQRTAGVPLVLPSLDFMLKLINDRWPKGGTPLLSELVFPNQVPEKQIYNFLNKEWLQLCDYYDGTYAVNYFDSFKDLKTLLSGPLKSDKVNKEKIYSEWKDVINNIK